MAVARSTTCLPRRSAEVWRSPRRPCPSRLIAEPIDRAGQLEKALLDRLVRSGSRSPRNSPAPRRAATVRPAKGYGKLARRSD